MRLTKRSKSEYGKAGYARGQKLAGILIEICLLHAKQDKHKKTNAAYADRERGGSSKKRATATAAGEARRRSFPWALLTTNARRKWVAEVDTPAAERPNCGAIYVQCHNVRQFSCASNRA